MIAYVGTFLSNWKEVAGLQNAGSCLQAGIDHQLSQGLVLFLWPCLREKTYPRLAFAAAQVPVSLGAGPVWPLLSRNEVGPCGHGRAFQH